MFNQVALKIYIYFSVKTNWGKKYISIPTVNLIFYTEFLRTILLTRIVAALPKRLVTNHRNAVL